MSQLCGVLSRQARADRDANQHRLDSKQTEHTTTTNVVLPNELATVWQSRFMLARVRTNSIAKKQDSRQAIGSCQNFDTAKKKMRLDAYFLNRPSKRLLKRDRRPPRSINR